MSLLNTLVHLLESPVHLGRQLANHAQAQPQPRQQAQQLQPQDPGNQGYLPDTTYNPNPNTNIPFSSHNMALVQRLNQIMHNPNLQGGTPYVVNDLANPTGLGGQANGRVLFNSFGNQPTQFQSPGNLPFGGLQGGYNRAAQPLRPGQIPFNQSDFRDTQISF